MKFLTSNIVGLMFSLAPNVGLSDEIPAHREKQIEDAATARPQAAPKKDRRVLVFITPPHLMPKDPHKGYCIPYGTHAWVAIGRKSGAYEAVVSDDLAMFLPENLGRFDAVVLNNSSGNWIAPTKEQVGQAAFSKHGRDQEAIEQSLRKSLLEYVRGGRGIVAIHYAIGANRHWPEFRELLGAQVSGHPWNEEVGIKVDRPDHPLVAAFDGRGFRLHEEVFQFLAPYSRHNQLVLLSIDTKTSNMNVKGLRRDDDDYALAWVRRYGQGRVFCTAFGHRTELYWNPAILRFYLAGVQFATGDLEAPLEPSQPRNPEIPTGQSRDRLPPKRD